MRAKATLIAVALGVAIAPAAQAHHGWSSYDAAQVIDISVTLTDLTWASPHGTAKISYKGKIWDVVLAPVARMETRGLTREMVGPGKTVRLVGYPKADGTPEIRVERVIVDGKTIELR
jgi:hypothetical protein